MTNEREEKVSESLLVFIDFLHAVVFGLIVSEAVEKTLLEGSIPTGEKIGRLVMLLAAFYFLTWDWIHGRLLTLRNPYTRYLRFFLEILIAACGYGVALTALARSMNMLLFIAAILLLGAGWAKITMLEHPQSADMGELRTVLWGQLLVILLTLGFYAYNLRFHHGSTGIPQGLIILVGGWFMVLFYELAVERREQGILGGPSVPFLPNPLIDSWRKNIRVWYAKQKGR